MGRMRSPNYHLQTNSVMGFKRKKVRYDAPGDGTEPDKHAQADLALAKRIGQVLEAHYPDHPWMVQVDHAQGCVFLSLPILMRRTQRFVVHTSTLANDPGLRAIVRAGGEILERYNVPRSGFRLDHFLHARHKALAVPARPRLLIPS